MAAGYDTPGKRAFPNTAEIKDRYSRGNVEQPLPAPTSGDVGGRRAGAMSFSRRRQPPYIVRAGVTVEKCYLEFADDAEEEGEARPRAAPAGPDRLS